MTDKISAVDLKKIKGIARGIALVDAEKKMKKRSTKNDETQRVIENRSIVLLLDTSTSMIGEKMINSQNAMCDFVDQIDLSLNNKIGLVTYGDRVNKFELSQNAEDIKEDIMQTKASGLTPMLNALEIAFGMLKDERGPIIVLATDGHPTDAPKVDVLNYSYRIREEGVVVIVLSIGTGVDEDFIIELSDEYLEAKMASEIGEEMEKATEIIGGLPPS